MNTPLEVAAPGVFTGWGAGAAATGAFAATPQVGARVAIWGDKAADTRDAVLDYIARPEGLQVFLEIHAGWKKA